VGRFGPTGTPPLTFCKLAILATDAGEFKGKAIRGKAFDESSLPPYTYNEAKQWAFEPYSRSVL